MTKRTTNLIIDLVDGFHHQVNALLHQLLEDRSAELTEYQQRLERMVRQGVEFGQQLTTMRTALIKANEQLRLKQLYIEALEAKIKQLSK